MKLIKVTLVFFLLILFSLNSFAQKKNIKITTKKNSDKSVDFYYSKEKPGSYYLSVNFSDLKNTNDPNFKGVVNDYSGFLFKLNPKNDKKSIGYSYKYSWKRGVPSPKFDSLFVYALPFKAGKKIGIIENSNVTEKYLDGEKPKNWKSYSSPRINADTIFAMRKGIVVNIVNKYERDTLYNTKYTSHKNNLLVEHTDGTYSSYKGFKKNSFFVKLGQTIYPHTELGILEKVKDSKYGHNLIFSVFYYTDFKSNKKRTLKNNNNRLFYISPYFQTSEGVIQLKHKSKHIVSFDTNLLVSEFTKREKRKYKKNPEIF